MRSTSAATIHDARIALPPTKGVQLKMAPMVPPGVNVVAAVTCRWSMTMAGSFDQGPVQATTMTMRMMIGSQPWNTSPGVSPCPSACASCAAVTGTPP